MFPLEKSSCNCKLLFEETQLICELLAVTRRCGYGSYFRRTTLEERLLAGVTEKAMEWSQLKSGSYWKHKNLRKKDLSPRLSKHMHIKQNCPSSWETGRLSSQCLWLKASCAHLKTMLSGWLWIATDTLLSLGAPPPLLLRCILSLLVGKPISQGICWWLLPAFWSCPTGPLECFTLRTSERLLLVTCDLNFHHSPTPGVLFKEVQSIYKTN